MAVEYRQISELTQASTIANSDLFVVQQGTTAKKCTGSTFLAMVEAHGGITAIAKTSTSGKVDTYTITYADGTSPTTFTVTNGNDGAKGDTGSTGNGIASVVLNADYTLTLTFTNGTSYTTSSIRGQQGATGETGATGNGIASAVLNQDYTLTLTFTDGTTYTTTSIRGATGSKGDAGDSAEILDFEWGKSAVETTQPTEWYSTISALIEAKGEITSGQCLWSKTSWNDGNATYNCAKYGIDGIYPIVSSLAWNSEVRAGTVAPSITLPTPPTTTTAELRYIFTASGTTASFTAPSGYILGNDDGFSGLSAGNTLTLTVTSGYIYECSFAVIDSTHIGLYMKEWKV